MFDNLDFPAQGIERMSILAAAEDAGVCWADLNEREKVIFIHAMSRGYYQGKREQARATIDRFTSEIVGFRP